MVHIADHRFRYRRVRRRNSRLPGRYGTNQPVPGKPILVAYAIEELFGGAMLFDCSIGHAVRIQACRLLTGKP